MFRTLATSTVALIAGAAPLFAEVTPAQVWENLTKYYDEVGYEVAVGSRDDSGQTLTLNDVTIRTSENEDYSLLVTLPKVTLQQTGDAKVRTVFDDITADFASTLPEDQGGETRFGMNFAMPGNEMLTSGTPEEMLHEMNYPSIVVTLDIPEPQAEGNPNPVTMTLTDLKGTQTTKVSGGTESVYDMTAASLGVTLAVDEPAEEGAEANGKVTGEFSMADLAMSGRMTTPEGRVDLTNDMAAALNAGMQTDGKLVMGATTGSFDFTGTDENGAAQNGKASFSAENAELSFTMSKDGVSYEGKSGPTQAEMTMPNLPMPLSYSVEGSSGAVSIPVSKSDQPQGFKLAYEITGLTLADAIWDLFDQGGQLPRDPASLQIDLEGDALLSQDLFDPALAQKLEEAGQPGDAPAEGETPAEGEAQPDAQPEMAEAMPFLPQTVKINRIALDAAGVTADVSGQLDLSQNPQEPVGEINGSFTGVNALMDKLIAMGLVPQEQAMGMRMMLAMFAKPVDNNPDQLESKLEFREAGSIFANGQQVK